MYNGKYAIVIGGSHFNPLGIVRSLGEAGVKTVYINSADWGFAESSKYVIKTVHTHSDGEIIRAILSITDEFGGRPPVYPSCDFSALLIDSSYEILKDRVICPGCSGNLKNILEKDKMCQLAEDAGFNVPKTKSIHIGENFRAELEQFQIPFILKPISNFKGSKNDIYICTDKKELDDIVEHFKWYKDVIIQSYINGGENLTVEYCGCKVPGQKVQVFGQLEKIREYPVDRGSTSYAVIKEDITYVDIEAIDRLLEKSGFSGIFDLELKVADGVPYFIEINYRNGAPAYAFTKAGFNLHAIWYKLQTGEKTEAVSLKETRLICEGIDLSHVFEKRLKLSEWLKNYLSADAHMIANKKDWKPFIKQYKLLAPYLDSKLHPNG